MSTEDLVDLASNYQYDDLCCAFERLEPADSSEAPAGFVRRLAGEPGQRAFRAVWSDRYV
ncbi:hypothetical protein FOA52_003960 [Chlamydomonas sp. UWO 241]|nr:hypothetical protein FOA52_003960 [Chlamydomonas sp. UWO 241]